MPFTINPSETNGPLANLFTENKDIKAVIPICPYSFMANRKFLLGYLPWLNRYVSDGIIVLGDYLERHNIEVFENLDASLASQKSLTKGVTIWKKIQRIVGECELQNLTSLKIKDVISSNEYKKIYSKIKKYSFELCRFDEDITEQVFTMLSTNERSRFILSPITPAQLNILKEYLFEEIAFYIYAYQKGYKIEIYPGRDMLIMRRIAIGEYPDFPYDFSNRTHISIKQVGIHD